jgi:TRAP-type C4-dicarboxylate transport system substrate-binding protein
MGGLAKTLSGVAAGTVTIGLALAWTGGAAAQTKTLKMHAFGPERSVETKFIFEPLQADVEKNSGGALKIQVYFGMSLGGKPADLISQVTNGVVDISYTLPGYHAGRFPILEGLELPFVGKNGEQTSVAAWDWIEKHAYREFTDFKLISISAIDSGLVHTARTPVRKLEDMKGLKLRVAGRYIGMAVASFGAVPVQMPLPDVYDALAKGQVQGMMIPWLITIPFKLNEVVKYSTDIPIFHSLLLIVMNNDTWKGLTAEQKRGIEASMGRDYARRYGKAWDDGADSGRKVARDRGNEIIKLSAQEEKRWHAAAKGAHDAWIDEMNKKGLNGQQMFKDLLAIMAKYEKS